MRYKRSAVSVCKLPADPLPHWWDLWQSRRIQTNVETSWGHPDKYTDTYFEAVFFPFLPNLPPFLKQLWPHPAIYLHWGRTAILICTSLSILIPKPSKTKPVQERGQFSPFIRELKESHCMGLFVILLALLCLLNVHSLIFLLILLWISSKLKVATVFVPWMTLALSAHQNTFFTAQCI